MKPRSGSKTCAESLPRRTVRGASVRKVADEFTGAQGQVERQRTRSFLYQSTRRLSTARYQGREFERAAHDEQRFERQHQREAVRRLPVAAQIDAALRVTPLGGYWQLGDRKTHTPGCELLAGTNLSVRQLRRISPLVMHAGCGCRIGPARPGRPWARSAHIRRAEALERD